MRRLFRLLILALLVPVFARAQTIRYEVSVTAAARQFHVAAEFPAAGKDTLLVSLPAWSPGSYEIQNYARYVFGFGAKNPAGQALRWDRGDKDTWRIVTGGADRVTVEFNFAADTIDLSIARSVENFAQFLGTNLFLFEEGQLGRPAEVRFRLELPGFETSTGEVRGTARVVRLAGPGSYGLNFLGFDEGDSELIRRYLTVG